MDRAPNPGMPEEPETHEEAVRKRRLLKRLHGFMTGHEDGVEELDLTATESSETEPGFGELWSRDEEAEESLEGVVPRVQRLGHNVLEQTWAVHSFAESLSDTVDDLPAESRDEVKPEADRLKEATGELRDAAEELDEELAELEEPSDLEEESPEDNYEPAPAEEPEVAKPKKDHSEAMGMARLVIATLIGGGLGALVGEGSKKKEKGPTKEKAKMSATIEQQKTKMAAQEAELQQLKAAKPEATPEKEYVKKATELAERQTELTHATVEQIRVATKEATEEERSFKIPEKPAGEKLAGEERLAVESVEKIREKSADRRGDKGQEAPKVDALKSEQKEQLPYGEVQKQIIMQQQSANQPIKLRSLTWIYGVLLALAAIVAIGLLFFGSR